MTTKHLILLSTLLMTLYSGASLASDIISCDSFENCPDGSEPLTNALLDLQNRMEALEAENEALSLSLDDLTAAEEDWTNFQFLNGWGEYGVENVFGAPSYYKDRHGVVHLRGLTSGGTCDQTMFTLPEGYRPTHIAIFSPTSSSSVGSTAVYVYTDGNVRARINCNSGWLSLWGISFRTY